MEIDSDPQLIATSAAAMFANLSHTIGVLQKLVDTLKNQSDSYRKFDVHNNSNLAKARASVINEVETLESMLIGAKIRLKQMRKDLDKAHKVNRQG